MKYLTQFLKFNWDLFARDKYFMATACAPLDDYKTKAHIGTKVTAVITSDKTAYKQKDGEQATNRFEKVVFKVKKDINIPLDAYVIPVNAVAKVYGEYNNQLSITCDDIQVVSQAKSANGISRATV